MKLIQTQERQFKPTRGTNQYARKYRVTVRRPNLLKGIITLTCIISALGYTTTHNLINEVNAKNIVSPLPKSEVKITIEPTVKPTVIPTPTPSELSEIVAYIAQVFEPEGKAVVVKAINCFYSESGLRPNAVGQNTDAPRSKDHGVAQLNDYWHKLTDAQKTEYRANIDKAYEIYKGRGNFSAWYGKGCR